MAINHVSVPEKYSGKNMLRSKDTVTGLCPVCYYKFFDTFDILFLPIPVSLCNCLTPACLLSRAARIINAADIIVKRCIYKCCQFIHTDSAKYGIDVAQGEEICPVFTRLRTESLLEEVSITAVFPVEVIHV